MNLDAEEKRKIEEQESFSRETLNENQKVSEQIYEKANSARHMMQRNELHNENNMRQKLLKNRKKRLNKKKLNILVYVLFLLLLALLIYLYWNNKVIVNQWFMDIYDSLLEKF